MVIIYFNGRDTDSCVLKLMLCRVDKMPEGLLLCVGDCSSITGFLKNKGVNALYLLVKKGILTMLRQERILII